MWDDDGETIRKMECCAKGAEAVETKELNTNRDAVNDVFQDKYNGIRHGLMQELELLSDYYYSSH